MLEKRKRSTENKKQQAWWLLILVGGIVPLTLVLGSEYGISNRITIPIIVIAALIFCSMWVWIRANAHATGDEWWQDDSASGWRGY
jgi:undecaprenyl pyrophosphate phosphatase UppP